MSQTQAQQRQDQNWTSQQSQQAKANGAWVWVKWKQGATQEAQQNAWKNWWADGKNQYLKQGWDMTSANKDKNWDWDSKFWLQSDNINDINKYVESNMSNNQWVEKTQIHPASQWK